MLGYTTGTRAMTLVVLTVCYFTLTECRKHPNSYEPDCKEGSPQKHKIVRGCCILQHVEKKCLRLCSTNKLRHIFKGAHLCSYKYERVVQACHCGVSPEHTPVTAEVVSRGSSQRQSPWQHDKQILLLLVTIPTCLFQVFYGSK